MVQGVHEFRFEIIIDSVCPCKKKARVQKKGFFIAHINSWVGNVAFGAIRCKKQRDPTDLW